MKRQIVSEEFPVLSDLISQSFLHWRWPSSAHASLSLCWRWSFSAHASLSSSQRRSFFTHISLSQDQFQQLMSREGQIQQLMNWIQELKNTQWLSHSIMRPVSVMSPSLRCDTNLFSSVRVTNNEGEKVKANPLFIFESPDNIQLWILNVNDYFALQKITDLNAQVTVTCSYLRDTLHQCMQQLHLTEDVELFFTWLKLQAWLLAHYSLSDADLKTDLAINKLQMWPKESV